MSGMPPSTPLDQYMRKLEGIVREMPSLAPLAYARAAAYVRGLATRPENAKQILDLQAIACRLDQMALEAVVTEVDDIADYPETTDNPSGGIQTEFDGVVEDYETARVDDNGTVSSELAQSAIFNHLQKARKREVALPVQITPESAGDDSNLLSDTVLVRFGGSTGSGSYVGSGGVSGPVVAKQEAQVIKWDGAEHEVMPCTIALNRIEGGANATYPTGASGSSTLSYRPFARVVWGSGSRGRANEAFVDVGRGTQFTINANHVYVNVGMDSFTASVTLTGTVTYVAGSMYLSGNLGFFAGQSTAPVTRTRYIDFLAAAGTATVTIPAFAQYLLPPQSTVLGTTGTTQLDFQDVNGNLLYALQFTNGTVVSPIPISNDAYQVVVTNVAGADASYRLVFQLAI